MTEPTICEYCGQEFSLEQQTMPRDVLFCSAECRTAAEKQDPDEGRGGLLVAGRSPWSRWTALPFRAGHPRSP